MRQTRARSLFPTARTSRRAPGGSKEHPIQGAVLQWVNTIPRTKLWRQNRGAKLNLYTRRDGTEGRSFVKFGEPGACDTTGLTNGIRLEIEVKRPGEAPDFEQDNYMGMIRDGGGIAFWVDSLDSCVRQLKAEFLKRGWTWRETWEVR